MKRILFSLTLFLSAAWLLAQVPQPKREFRGAWIQAVNGQFQGMTPDAMRQNLTHQLDELRACGINVIIFQVRPECDALYASPYEPWSRFLSGKQGEAPSPYWDPLQWMIEQCHNRGMELHAWINPFRAKTKGTTDLAPRSLLQLRLPLYPRPRPPAKPRIHLPRGCRHRAPLRCGRPPH